MSLQTASTPILITTIFISCALLIALILSVISLFKERRRNLILSLTKDQHKDHALSLDQEIGRLRTERSNLFTENRNLTAQLSAMRTSLEAAEQRAAEQSEILSSTRKQLEKDFHLLAEKILTQKSKVIHDSHKDGLQTMLQPMREQLQEFRQKIEHVHSQETKDRTVLINEIEHLKKLNLKISEDAVNLTSALKGKNKLQGLWGEMILERLLEDSGLTKGHEYETQVALKDKNGRSRIPDVLVRLPENRAIIIDAKVSLKAFENACRAKEATEEKNYLQQHLDSLKKHISGLASKQYQLLESVQSPDFVILFLPTEGAFQAAVAVDPNLLNTAMENKIILASPSTLLAVLKIAHHMWRQDEQTRNSLTIAKQAGNLYDKFMGFLDAFDEIGTRLEQSHNAWETARKRLSHGRGNLVSRAESIRKLGVQNSKQLPLSFANEYEDDANHGKSLIDNQG